jgi:hypothetical protein
MTPTIPTGALLAGNPGPAAHIGMLAVVVIVGLIAVAIVRRRNAREAAHAQRLDHASQNEHQHGGPHEPPRGGSTHH